MEQANTDPRLELLWNVFLGRKDAYMEYKGSWLCVKQEITKEDVAEHLAGRRCLGSYLLSPEAKVRYLAYDFDSHDKPEEKPSLRTHIMPLAAWFRKRSIGTFIEDTGGFGYHLWVLFHDDIFANKVIKLANNALKEAGISFEPEIFPKQTKLEAGKFGNGIRLPWGLHSSGKWSHFLNDSFEPDDGNAIESIKSCRTISWKTFDELLPPKVKGVEPPATAKGIAPRRWCATIPEGSRHNSLFALACEFRSRRFTPDRILTELQTHNESRMNPPLSDEEVRQIYEGAMKTTGATNISERDSQASLLVDLAMQKVELFHTPEQKGYACFNNGHDREVWPLHSSGFKGWLMKVAYREIEKVPYSEAINTALATLEGLALYDHEEKPLFLRVAWHDNALLYDLGNWLAVRVTKTGWTVEIPPIVFRHYAHQMPQVQPQPGNVRDFLQFTNVTDEGQRELLLVYLCCTFIPDIPQPLLFIHGDQGSGKSMLLRFIREVADPSTSGLLTMPDNLRDLGHVGHHHRCVFLDNVRHFPPWLIEGMSRLATGACFTKRALFTDEDEVIFRNKGLGGFNGISLEVDAPDLLDRGLFIRLTRLPDDKAMPEDLLVKTFHAAKPGILGGIFDTLSKALTVKETQSLLRLPRMADFYSWGCAIASVLGFENFSTVYWDNVKYGSQQALDASIIAPIIEKFMRGTPEWQGSSSELLAQLNQYADDSTKKLHTWPKDPQWLSRKVAQITPNLAQAGLTATKTGRTWSFRWMGGNLAYSVIGEAESVSDAIRKDSVSSNTTPDATDDKKRYPEKIASNVDPKLDDAMNAISLPTPSKVDYYTADGEPVMIDEWLKRWEEEGGKPIQGRDGKIRDIKAYLNQEDPDFENVSIIRKKLWPKGDWPREPVGG